jgi:hypothetical protein
VKTYGGVEVQLHMFLTSVPGRGECSASRPGSLSLEEKAELQSRSESFAEIFLILPGIEPRFHGHSANSLASTKKSKTLFSALAQKL